MFKMIVLATYMMKSDANLIVVLAVRFAASKKPFYPLSSRAPNHRVEIGQLHAVVSGDGGQCSQAIETYLKSLVK